MKRNDREAKLRTAEDYRGSNAWQTLTDDDLQLIPPIPKELETAIRCREDAAWLPWEVEVIKKVFVWGKNSKLIKR